MAKRKFLDEEKSNSSFSFKLYYVKPVSVALYSSEKQGYLKILSEINKIRKDKNLKEIGSSNLFKKIFLKGLDAKDENEMMSKYPSVRKIVNNEVFNATLQSLGLPGRQEKGVYGGDLPLFWRGVLSKLKEEKIDEIRSNYNI